MNKLDLTNYYEDLSLEEIEKLYIKYLNFGFDYNHAVHIPYVSFFPSSIKTPSGKILTRSDIKGILSRQLVIGDREQIEAIEAAELFKITDAYYGSSD